MDDVGADADLEKGRGLEEVAPVLRTLCPNSAA